MNFETFFKKAMIYLLIIVIIIFAFKLILNMRKLDKMESRLNNLQKQVTQEVEENKKLKDEIKKVKSPDYIEKVAREELGLVKPGEILFIPVEEDEKQEDNQEKQQSENE